MKTTIAGVCMLFASAACAATLDLAGEGWRLDGTGKDGKEAISLPMRVPCDVQTVLLDAGKMENPFWGDNERRTQWPASMTGRFRASSTSLRNSSQTTPLS